MHGTLVSFALLGLGIMGLATSGCDDNVVGLVRGPEGGGGGAGPGAPSPRAHEIDILLSIDNSRSMADKQQLLALGIPELVSSLVDPPCVDVDGVPTEVQPDSPSEACPPGAERRHRPDLSIHIGVVSSSLGDYGGDACPAEPNPSNDDRGHLLTRGAEGNVVPTHAELGFLAWDPSGEASPPGLSDLDAFTSRFVDLVAGAGQDGCGYEAQLEGWYRFLVDPEPSASIALDGDGNIAHEGLDVDLLAQRAAFLRPESLLLVLVLTDENDCSVRQEGQFYVSLLGKSANGTNFRLPRARAECATDPSDPCCLSCLEDQSGCPVDPQCDAEPLLSAQEDHINLRCFQQKRRFGIDFLYPTGRYVAGLSDAQIENRAGVLVDNPVFAGGRDPRLVLMVGVVGVPWQSVARRDQNGRPDLVIGRDASGAATGGFMSAAELVAEGVWDQILGDPESFVPPSDPFMRESIEMREGVNAATGESTNPPPANNPINGSEYSVPNRDDLQYACIFPLPVPRDCATDATACDCTVADNDNPLCAANPEDPVDPSNRTLQVAAKAFPSLRVLDVLKGMGDRGLVTSICPAPIDDVVLSAYGYRPALRSLFELAQPLLAKP